MKGRGTGKFKKGERLLNFDGLAVKDLIACYSRQFEALNLIKIVALHKLPSGHRLADWRYAAGDEGGRMYGNDPEYVQGSVWESDIDGSDKTVCHYEWHRAVMPERKGTLTINNYAALLDYFGVETRSEFNAEIQRRVGTPTATVCVTGDIGSETGFIVNADDTVGDSVNNHFEFPLDEENLKLGLTELECQCNPDKAATEGEEFMLVMGSGDA